MINPEQIDFSVVIPTFNRPTALQQCLARLAPETQIGGRVVSPRSVHPTEQTVREFSYEVIVSDDGNSKEDREHFTTQYPWMHWVQGPGKGPATNRNTGARKARGDWLVFLDDDCLPESALLKAYWDKLREDPHALVLEGRIEPEGPKRYLRETAPINLDGGYLWSCNFAIKFNFFWNQLNGFCEEFPYPCMEDVDLKLRIGNLRTTMIFCKQARVVHPWRIQTRTFRQDYKIHRFSLSLYYKRHPNQRPHLTISIRHACGHFVRDLITALKAPNVSDFRYFIKRQSIRFLLLLHLSKMRISNLY